MHFKKTITLLSFLLVSACSERNTEYYETHIDEAEVKTKECEVSIREGFVSKDEEKFEKLAKDPECNSAMKVVRQHEKKLAQMKYEQKQKELEQLKQDEEKKYKEEYSQHLSSLNNLGYREVYELAQECHSNFSMSRTAKCQALQEVNELNVNEEI